MESLWTFHHCWIYQKSRLIEMYFLSGDSRPSPFLPYTDLVLRLLTSRVDRYSPVNLQIISAPERKMLNSGRFKRQQVTCKETESIQINYCGVSRL